MHRNNDIRVYVRNKSRYNPETKEKGFLFVDVHDFAGTTIGQIKEDVRRQCKGSIRIDELFLNNLSLADDRSVAHYNLDNGCILETTSNPFWVSCLYIKASEIRQEQEGNPTDENIQKWTQKSLPKKYTLIGLLLNAKNEYGKQPPHFATLDEFAIYLERLNKKGATMHPDYTQKDMRAFEREYRQEFLGRYDDPLAAYLDHHAVRLGHVLPDEIEQAPGNVPHVGPRLVAPRQNNASSKTKSNMKRNQRYCEDCEEVVAEVYCTECQGGLAMCRRCSAMLHAGASRRRHNLQDMDQAPAKSTKPYVPRAFQAPFAIILAMYSALNERQMLSLTENDIKKRAQLLTDTDLQDKQAGKYVGGFDCMENNLMNKGLVKKEAARIPTYALSASGQVLGEKLYTFYTQFYRFMESCRLPKVQNQPRNGVVNNRKLCLIIDENERDKDRLLRYAGEKNIDAQVRLLPAGDYIWVLTPPMVDPHVRYTGKDSDNEMVLPFVVERKSWEDFENSTNSARFQRQINNMLGCGLANCFYLMEGSMSGLRNNPTHHQQHYLKQQLEKLITENGFYVNYTSSWMKSAQWLLWFTGFLMDGLSSGAFLNQCIPYREYMSRVARQRGSAVNNATFRNATRHTHTWRAMLFVDHIIRDSEREQNMMSVIQDMGVIVGDRRQKHLLVVQDLEQYNKKRQSSLNKCCEAVYHNPRDARDIVEDKLGPVVHNMMHYDVACYWQLYIQILTGVYVVRTENAPDTDKIQRLFGSAIPAQIPLSMNIPDTPGIKGKNVRSRNPGTRKKTATATSGNPTGDFDQGYSSANSIDIPLNQHLRKRNVSGSVVNKADKTDYNSNYWKNKTTTDVSMNDRRNYDEGSDSIYHVEHDHGIVLSGVSLDAGAPRGPNTLSIYSLDNSGQVPPHTSYKVKDYAHDDNDNHGKPGSVIKKGRNKLNTSVDHGQLKQTGVRQCDVQPFSGEGYCLGSVIIDEGLNSSINSAKVNMTDGSYGILRNTRSVHTGLVGGTGDLKNSTFSTVDRTIEHGDETGEPLNDTVINAADYTDSQNEEDIMLKILAESAAEMKSKSNEDEMLKLAVEMSVQSASIRDTDKLTEEEQVQLALEMSKTSESCRTYGGLKRVGLSYPTDEGMMNKQNNAVCQSVEDKELQQVLEMSKNYTKTELSTAKLYKRTDEPSVTSVIDEDQMLNFASEISLKDFQIVNNHPDIEVDDDVDVIVINDEINCQKVGENERNSDILGDCRTHLDDRFSDDINKNRKCNKRKRNDNNSIKNENNIGVSLSEEEQLTQAIEMSLACNSSFVCDKTDESKSDTNLAVFDANADRSHDNDMDDDLRMAIEQSKVEHSPVKKIKLGNNYVDEEEALKIILEKSKKEVCAQVNMKHVIKDINDQYLDSTEVIEINSQNSQEGIETIDTDSGYEKNIFEVDSSFSVDAECSVHKQTESEGKASNVGSDIDIQGSDVPCPLSLLSEEVHCTESDKGIVQEDVYTSLSDNANCDGKVNAKGDGCAILQGDGDREDIVHSNEDEEDYCRNEPDDFDDDYVPPSPTTVCTPDVSFKQIYFSRTPNSADVNKSLSSECNEVKVCKKDRKKKSKEYDFISNLIYDSEESTSDSDTEEESDSDEEKESNNYKSGKNTNSDKNEIEYKSCVSGHVKKNGYDINSKVLCESSAEGQLIGEKESSRVSVGANVETVSNGDSVIEGIFETNQNDENVELSNLGVFDDDTHMDYQPDSQYVAELDEAYSTDSKDDCDNELDESTLEKLDPELLPVIRRPRRIRYRELQAASERLLQQKKQEMLSSNNHCGNVKTEFSDETRVNGVTLDELYARQLQEHFDNDTSAEGRSIVDDEFIARQMQEMFDKERPQTNADSHIPLYEQQQMTSDLVNSSLGLGSTACNTGQSIIKTMRENSDQLENKPKDKQGNPDYIIRELQRREFEKLERWKQLLVEDERLAKRMQEMHDVQMSGQKETDVATQRKEESSQTVTPSFKHIVAKHKASREKAFLQLQEYRTLQMERFQGSRSQSSHTVSSVPDRYTGLSNTQQHDVIIVDEPTDLIADQRHHLDLTNTQLNLNHHSQTNANMAVDHPSDHNNATLSAENSFTQTGFAGSSGQMLADDHSKNLTNQSNLESGLKNSNITCGNCGEKGHNRTYVKCPRYHSAEESARRKTKLEKQKQQKEEKKQQEVETIHLLTEHRRVLEDMTTQIQREMNTIQHRIQQRASELESQVNVRVKKMEGAKKKKK